MMLALKGEAAELAGLVRDPEHRESLYGTGLALLVSIARSTPRFTRHDGMFRAPEAIRALTRRYSPDRAFSPSQLETYAYCPHRYFMKYVLGVERPIERDLLEFDPAARGSLFHEVVELAINSVKELAVEDRATLGEAIALAITPAIEVALGKEREPASALEKGLAEIRTDDLKTNVARFLNQARKFDAQAADGLWPEFAEWNFGEADSKAPPLVLGAGDDRVVLQGRVDRVDVAEGPGGVRFRIIDYKTGKGHGTRDFLDGIALQLPLYAMAFANWKRADQNAEALPVGYGYWSLKGKGYAPIEGDEREIDESEESGAVWDRTAAAVERFALELVARLRQGAFPVHSRRDNCTSACDYANICKIVRMRRAGKAWPEEPVLIFEDEP